MADLPSVPLSGITREELEGWGGKDVFSQGLALCNSGDVSDVRYNDETLTVSGKIRQRGGWEMPVAFRLERAGRIRSLCPCAANQRDGRVCPHVLAVGIALWVMETEEAEKKSGEVGKWKSGEVGKWKSGEVGKWRSGEVEACAFQTAKASPATLPLFHPSTFPLFLVHMDLYRLRGEEDVLAVGWEDYLADGAILAVEWPDRAGSLIPATAKRVAFEHLDGEERRRITFGGAAEKKEEDGE